MRSVRAAHDCVGMSLVLIAACGLASALACDRDLPDPVFDRPAPRLLETSPQQQERGFPLERALRVRFDRYLHPASVIRQSVLVTPGIIDAESGEYTGSAVFFEPAYDPYDNVVAFQLETRRRWVPTTLYSVRLLVPVDAFDITGFKAFDGAPLENVVAFSFMTGSTVSNPDANVDDAVPRVRFCEHDDVSTKLPAVSSVLHASCAKAGCHGSSPASGPMLGLDLSHPAAIANTAIRVVARQTMTGPSVAATSTIPARFGDDMPRLDPHSAGNSYLVYKLLVNAGNHPSVGEAQREPDPWLGGEVGLSPAERPSPEETARLRSWFVRGEPMPLNGRLEPDEMRAIVRWVLRGAATPACSD